MLPAQSGPMPAAQRLVRLQRQPQARLLAQSLATRVRAAAQAYGRRSPPMEQRCWRRVAMEER